MEISMKRKVTIISALALSLSLLSGCTYNPFTPGSNDTTGSAAGTLIGAGAGAGSIALLGGTRYPIIAGGLVGGALGYYATTLRFASGGVMQTGGKVYKVGEIVGIYIPTDRIFELNTADFTPAAIPVLDSAAQVLYRYPNNNIIISGNTSGFGRPRREQILSEQRAAKVASYLWNAGIINFKEESNDMRKLQYVGYGDFFPIASSHRNEGVRENSRIQIISYPSNCDLGLDKRREAIRNIGALTSDADIDSASPKNCDKSFGSCTEFD
jgi:outer membrane protein OmpA-like peptidoglycan-associated protein